MKSKIKQVIKTVCPNVVARVRTWQRQLALRKRHAAQRRHYDRSGLEPRICQHSELFIRHDGSLYPCCHSWGRDYMCMGNLKDQDLIEKLQRFREYCACERYKMGPDAPDFGLAREFECLNIEMSLACNGQCAMCCVRAPLWNINYNLYPDLTQAVDRFKPRLIRVQGGEVLIQNRSLEWIRDMRRKHPSTAFHIVTNGNVGLDLAEMVESLFDQVIVSMVGFQPETYRTIMRLEQTRSLAFMRALTDRGKSEVVGKFLVTPLNLHEVAIYLDNMIDIGVHGIRIDDADTKGLIHLHSPFWRTVLQRAGDDIRSVLVKRREDLVRLKLKVLFDTHTMRMYDIRSAFIAKHALENNVLHAVRAGGETLSAPIV